MKRFVFGCIGLCLAAAAVYAALSPGDRAYVQARLSDTVPQIGDAGLVAPPRSAHPVSPWQAALITAARAQIGVTTGYDGAYASLAYPMGDVPRQTGVCTDVVIRALRDAHGIDLQALVHQDMRGAFSAYPAKWGLTRPDRNIDHRRVPNLRRYFERHAQSLPVSDEAQDYLPGDLVTWMFAPGQPHIGIVSDRVSALTGEPLILHNAGAGTREQRFLFAYPITGHYRLNTAQQIP
ncbi:DUF1287 domain-containing protein [Actibacterium sp. XHP0104]|uniref:DUF1287 domain-containing protein n=1 Tax=Actibacterium sp. XHP0104 TaxID=2984335 RepID=UPI0021E8082C|nr:DUF1287 domain-containing protein [Actibacterium sp. XHP0104]MCV2880943.1 DUF1287 domain-containing protein [Actibacterium sp. XHP0104]